MRETRLTGDEPSERWSPRGPPVHAAWTGDRGCLAFCVQEKIDVRQMHLTCLTGTITLESRVHGCSVSTISAERMLGATAGVHASVPAVPETPGGTSPRQRGKYREYTNTASLIIGLRIPPNQIEGGGGGFKLVGSLRAGGADGTVHGKQLRPSFPRRERAPPRWEPFYSQLCGVLGPTVTVHS